MIKTLLIDNYDSYTYNLFDLLCQVNGAEPLVIHNDLLNWDQLRGLDFDNIVISPGPGQPGVVDDFGVCADVLRHATVPVLGVCLGHQGLAHVYGGVIAHAPTPMHGRISQVTHNGDPLFENVPSPFAAVRYHSLIVSRPPACLEAIAWSQDGLIMGLKHRSKPLWGVQFHPESICSEYGRRILENFAALTPAHDGATHRPDGAGRAPARPAPSMPRQAAAQAASAAAPRVHTRCLDMLPDPEAAFSQLYADQPVAFWLDSSLTGPGAGRFSFMGSCQGPHAALVQYRERDRQLMLRQDGHSTTECISIFDFLQRELSLRACPADNLPFDFNCGFVGYFGYELKAECGGRRVHDAPQPDAAFILADRIVAFDHLEQKTYLLCHAPSGQEAAVEDWFQSTTRRLTARPPDPIPTPRQPTPVVARTRLARSRETYLRDIASIGRQIQDGQSYEVCLTNKLIADVAVDAFALYRTLRRLNPAPYAAYLRFPEYAIACSSPERFLSIDGFGTVESKPIKGTIGRGATDREDEARKQALRSSEKERAENLMIVDLLRNDLARVCRGGSVRVPAMMEVESYATLHQLVSTIVGQLRPEAGAIDCIRAAFPGGSMTGAPKLRTMDIIDRVEGEARGIYSGAIGWLSLCGAADLNIAIRTAVVTPDRVSVGAGGAIVHLSDARREFEEMLLKARVVEQAIALSLDAAPRDAAASLIQSARRQSVAAPQPREITNDGCTRSLQARNR